MVQSFYPFLPSYQCPNATRVRKKMNLGIELDIVPHRRPLTDRLSFFFCSFPMLKWSKMRCIRREMCKWPITILIFYYPFITVNPSLANTGLVRTSQKYRQRVKAHQNIFSYREENVFSKSTSEVNWHFNVLCNQFANQKCRTSYWKIKTENRIKVIKCV